ncbi:ATP-binding protein [Paenibacillus endoradicis]|uniref:ATP-binding protein n=1 Tax=Paenibacillus endoradicis TaxID=2972487 RepID=UPI0021591040|nr:ATP-binding protein [Paenibacillus endoradicis]
MISDSAWQISKLDSSGYASDIGLELGDIVVQIDHSAVEKHTTVYKFHRIEKIHSITLLRNNSAKIITLDYKEFPLEYRSIIIFFTEIFMALIAITIYIRYGRSKSSILLTQLFILLSIAFMCTESATKSDSLSKVIISIVIILIPAIMIDFIYQLLKAKGQIFFSYHYISWYYRLVLLYCTLHLFYFSPWFDYRLYRIEQKTTLIHFMVGCLLTFLYLFYVYRRRRLEYSYSATVIKISLFSFTICFAPFLLLTVFPDIIYHPIVPYHYSMFVFVLYPFIFLILSYGKNIITLNRSLWRHLILPLRPLIWPYLYLKSIHKLMQSFTFIKSFEDFERYGLPDLCHHFNLMNATILITTPNKNYIASYKPIHLQSIEQLLKQDFKSLSAYKLFHISREEQQYCYLIVEHRRATRKISYPLQLVIDIIKFPIATLVENINLNKLFSNNIIQIFNHNNVEHQNLEQIFTLKRTILQLVEQERKHQATDLHDTLLQDILFARHRVLSLTKSMKSAEAMSQSLSDLAEYLQIINLNARDIIFNIYPHLLKETGFANAISSLVENERTHYESDIILSLEDVHEWNQLNNDDLLQVFRIIQELLSNAKKHSQSTKITLLFHKDANTLSFSYSDNGRGIENLQNFESTGWIGINHRVQSMNANILIQSSPMQGFQVKITIPRLGVS